MGYRWRGYEHPVLYKMITTGPGAAASEPQTVYWGGLKDELSKVDQDLNAKLTTLGASWEGKAAESAKTGLTPLAEWAADAETGSGVMRISTENQADYISDARARMPEPVEVTTQSPSGWAMVTAGAAALTGNPGPAVAVAAQAADHEAQEAAQSEAEQRAVETMQTYESSSTWNRDTLGTFVAPPDVVVSTPAPQGGTATAVLLGPNQVNNVGGSNGSQPANGHTQIPTTQNQGVVNVPAANETGGNTHVPQPNTDGGRPSTIPQVPPGTTTTPSEVFTPPVSTGGGGGGPFPTPTTLPPGGGPYPGPGPSQLPGPYPAVGGGDPFTGGGQNAQDIARRALPPVRGGFPGPGGFPGGGGPGGMPGGGGLAGGIDGERAPSQLGRGGLPGGLAGEGGVVRNAPGAAGAAGGRGGGVNGPMGGGGRRGEGEDDDEHFAPDYLMETDDVFGDDRKIAPTVIGE